MEGSPPHCRTASPVSGTQPFQSVPVSNSRAEDENITELLQLSLVPSEDAAYCTSQTIRRAGETCYERMPHSEQNITGPPCIMPPPSPLPQQGSWIPHLKCVDLSDYFFFCVCWNLSSAPSSWYYKFAIWGTIYYELLHNFDPGYHYKIMLKTRREILKRNIIQSVQRRHRIQVSLNFAEAGVLRPATPAGNQRGADMSFTCSPGIEYLDTLNEKWCVDQNTASAQGLRTKLIITDRFNRKSNTWHVTIDMMTPLVRFTVYQIR